MFRVLGGKQGPVLLGRAAVIRTRLFNVNYANPGMQHAPVGGIVEEFVCGKDDDGHLDMRYADMRAQWHVWQHRLDLDVVGFHGYRKHILLYTGEPAWHEVNLAAFRDYQNLLVLTGEDYLKDKFDRHKIIVTPPFKCINGEDMTTDFYRSRSRRDWQAVENILCGTIYRTDSKNIYNMFYIAPWHVFNEYMRFWTLVNGAITDKVTARDAHDGAYIMRPHAYIAERLFSMWLEAHWERLNPLVLPMITCWDAH